MRIVFGIQAVLVCVVLLLIGCAGDESARVADGASSRDIARKRTVVVDGKAGPETTHDLRGDPVDLVKHMQDALAKIPDSQRPKDGKLPVPSGGKDDPGGDIAGTGSAPRDDKKAARRGDGAVNWVNNNAGSNTGVVAISPDSTTTSKSDAKTASNDDVAASPKIDATVNGDAEDGDAKRLAKQGDAATGKVSRRDLLLQLRQAIAKEQDASMRKAMDELALSLIDPTIKVSPQLMARLDDRQRRLVEQYQAFLHAIRAQLAEGDGKLDRKAVLDQLDQHFGAQPIAIRTIELCRRVRGYGVYDPMPSSSFLAGKPHRTIVYVEIDHFQTKQVKGEYTVDLKQEIELYNDSDGTAVWKQPAVRIVDRSRNRRRDFFTVQLIELPRNLTVGSYLLKVRVYDGHGGSISERSIPLKVVAGDSLVRGGG